MTTKDKQVSKGKLVLTVDQIKQLANWVGDEPETEVVITRTVGDQGEGLYAYNIDHPDEGSIFLDGQEAQTIRIFSAEQLFGRKIPNANAELAHVAAKILYDFQAGESIVGLVGTHRTLVAVRAAVLTSRLDAFFRPWDNSEDQSERLARDNVGRQKQVRELFLDMEGARRRAMEEAAERVRRDSVAANIAS